MSEYVTLSINVNARNLLKNKQFVFVVVLCMNGSKGDRNLSLRVLDNKTSSIISFGCLKTISW